MTVKHKLWLVFCLLLGCLTAYPQHFYLRQLIPEDGLPSSIVYDFEQDSRGVLWIGTENGLCAFDGKIFINYTVKHGLPNNVVHGLVIDGKDRKWLTTLAEKPAVFANGQATIPPWADTIQLSNYYLSYTPADSLLWLNGYRERFDQSSTYALFIISGDSLKDYSYLKINFLNPVEFQGKNTLIAGRGLFRFDKDSLISADKYWIEQNLYNCQPYQDGFLCFWAPNFFDVDNRKLVFLDPSGPSIKRNFQEIEDFIAQHKANAFFIDRQENIWLSSRNGVLFVRSSREKDPEIQHLLPGIFANMIFQDHENNVWIGTEGDGCFLAISTKIKTLASAIGKEVVPIRSLTTDSSGNIYTGFMNGSIKKHNRNFDLIYDRKVSNWRVVDIVADSQGAWLATDRSVIRLDSMGNTRSEYLLRGPVKSLLQSGEKVFILSYRVEQLWNGEMITRATTPTRIYSSFNNPDQSIWLGASTGLYYFDELADSVILLNERIFSDVRGIALSKANIHWVATLGQGIFLMNGPNILRNLTTEQGLSSDICNDLLLDENYAWVATNKGINRINLETLETEVIGIEDGLSGTEVSYLAKSGRNILAATDKGLDIIPDDLQKYDSPPLLYLNTLRFGNDTLDFDTTNTYRVPFKKNNIQISFTGISFKSLGDITYAYQLEGLDEDWIQTTSTFANWASVPPGAYTLKLKAKGKNTIWSETIRVPVVIDLPWWKKWWFFALAAVLGLSVIGLIFLAVIGNIRRKNALQQRLQELQHTALRSQMNPHFMFNALNSIQEFINSNDSRSANIYLSRFASLVRSILNNSSKEYVRLAEEINQLKLYLDLENLRFNYEIDYRIVIDARIETEFTLIPTMLVQPFAENAIVHGLFHKKGEKKLDIAFSLAAEEKIVCTIKDNGIGRVRSAEINSKRKYEGESVGIKVTQDRLNLLSRGKKSGVSVEYTDHFEPENQTPAGTTATLIIPYKRIYV